MQLTVNQSCSIFIVDLAFTFHLDIPDVIAGIAEVARAVQREAHLHALIFADGALKVPAGEREIILLLHIQFVVTGIQEQYG